MGRDSVPPGKTTDSEVTAFMCEFARYLVAAGMTNERFADIARSSFYRAASISARFRNSRVNQSAVAAMTGLTRVQVREYSKEERGSPKAKISRVENLINGWSMDPAFTTSGYKPKRLSIGGKRSTFTLLVRKYGGDIPARAVLQEMIRTGSVTVSNNLVSLNPSVRRTRAQSLLQSLSRSLVELIQETGQIPSAVHSLQTLNREVSYPAVSSKGRILLQRRFAKSLDVFMAELEASGEAASLESPPNRARRGSMTRARVLLVCEELNRRVSEKGIEE